MKKYPVSKAKLYEELKRRNVTPGQASREIGFSAGYLANVALVGEMPARGALYLERVYHITPEDYQPDLMDVLDAVSPETPEKAIPDGAVKSMAALFAEAFRDTIRTAVFEAIKEARE